MQVPLSAHSLLLLLGFSLVLVACAPIQPAVPIKPSANPTAAPLQSIRPTSLPPGGSTAPIQPVATGAVSPQAYAPQPGDAALARADVFLDSATLLAQGTSPAHYILSLKGNLPTPCNALRVKVNPPDSRNQIMIQVYSLTDPNQMCAEVLKPFEQTVDLGSFPTGHYTVFVNGSQAGKFDA